MKEPGTSLIKKEVSPEEYAGFWGGDPCYDHPPRERGDGYMFYNFDGQVNDIVFLRKFILAIDRTILTADEEDESELKELQRIVKERLAKLEGKPMQTVNVIELMGENNISVRAYEDTPEGNKNAEDIFTACIKENADVAEADIPSYIEDGFFEEGDYRLFLVHST